jgi:hypothetical protein
MRHVGGVEEHKQIQNIQQGNGLVFVPAFLTGELQAGHIPTFSASMNTAHKKAAPIISSAHLISQNKCALDIIGYQPARR